MHRAQQQVEAFHRVIGGTIGEVPKIRDAELRATLILEEAIEAACAFVGAARTKDIALKFLELPLDTARDENGRPYKKSLRSEPNFAEAIQESCDVLYVTYGSVVTFGVDIEPFFDEVHRANLAKVGGGVRSDGKWMKPEGWQPPRIKEMLDDLLSGVVREVYTIRQVDGYGERDIIAEKATGGLVWQYSQRVGPDLVELVFRKVS